MNNKKIERFNSPKVSVCVISYNQENYIRECLQSLIEQDVNFSFEILVGDDGSTDDTPKMIEKYGNTYPEFIIPILREVNIGTVANIVDLYKRARGKYIAHMDGDDLAFPGKLQIQVDVLEGSPDCAMCTHDVILIDKTSKKIADSFKKHKSGINTLKDLYASLPFFAHSSKMFVNDSFASFYSRLSPTSIDIEIHVQQAKGGNIFHLNEKLGAYRVLAGVSSNDRRVSPLLPAATRRIFEDALSKYIAPYDALALKRYYAKALLNYSYQSAIFGIKEDFRSYSRESIGIKIVSLLQICIYACSFFPELGIFLARRRAERKSQVN